MQGLYLDFARCLMNLTPYSDSQKQQSYLQRAFSLETMCAERSCAHHTTATMTKIACQQATRTTKVYNRIRIVSILIFNSEPPSKILKSNSASGELKLCIKIENPNKQGGFEHVQRTDNFETLECEWENCLVCERDIPIMLQTQNPTWYANSIK